MENKIKNNFNLSGDGQLSVKDFWGNMIKWILSILIAVFPWLIVPFSLSPFELFRERFLFVVMSFLLVLWFFRSLARKEFEWRKTRLNKLLFIWLGIAFLLFLYAANLGFAWNGYPGSLTAGFSEYLAFAFLFFLSIQLFNPIEWEKKVRLFLYSTLLVLIFFIAGAIYFEDNNILTINFARTPTLVTAFCGVTAFAFWWLKKRSEAIVKGRLFLVSLLFLFIASLLDFYLAWWMWFAGILTLLFLDLIVKIENYLKEKESGYLNLKGSGKADFLSELFHGDFKYLSLILLFTFSRAVSPIFLGQKELVVLPYLAYLEKYALFGQRVFFYLIINALVFLFGLYTFFKLKKDRQAIGTVLSGLACISVGHLIYFSESTLLFFLNWLLLIFSGLTFLRKPPEKDFLYLIEKGTGGKKIYLVILFLACLFLTTMIYLKLLV